MFFFFFLGKNYRFLRVRNNPEHFCVLNVLSYELFLILCYEGLYDLLEYLLRSAIDKDFTLFYFRLVIWMMIITTLT